MDFLFFLQNEEFNIKKVHIFNNLIFYILYTIYI